MCFSFILIAASSWGLVQFYEAHWPLVGFRTNMILGHGANTMTLEEARLKLCAQAKYVNSSIRKRSFSRMLHLSYCLWLFCFELRNFRSFPIIQVCTFQVPFLSSQVKRELSQISGNLLTSSVLKRKRTFFLLEGEHSKIKLSTE